ncbi:uncharacterized protein PFL1_03355 [Pseudozyma flocculosa PF-1]|uniref:DNA replication regulator SLD2 n=2 Tax=Pseudozyma flocculosa TaxID=84751 RepID=A0A5C3F7A6_9BASI|nr:uncharacterized protein PFL1_03355 [Pseudozyma flocculosa PF-1]EPQ29066.1 hypothetical protein PFL1_03355 [Pseudozyma flocculosa PF-1]SPO40060.1 uncharacterized protein PSFLO_05542 [Pseudozyma flocculosa]
MESILRKELKQWQRQFRAKHGREPTKRDILRHPEIASTYDTWNAISAEGGASKPKPSRSSSACDGHASSSTAHTDNARARKDHAHHRRDHPPAPEPKRRRDDTASTSSAASGTQPDAAIFKTPTKPRRSSDTHPSNASSTPTHGNPFRTPSRSDDRHSRASSSTLTPQAQRTVETGGRQHPPPSPTGSIIDVQMTPTKASPSGTTGDRYDYAASPSKLRMLVASHSTRSPINDRGTGSGANIADRTELITYTPRTKARKRLRGEEVPPTPKQHEGGKAVKRGTGAVFAAFLASKDSEGDGSMAVSWAQDSDKRKPLGRGNAVGGLAAYGFGSLGKPSASKQGKFGPTGQKSKSLGSALGVGITSLLKPGQRAANGVPRTAEAVGTGPRVSDDEDDDDDDDEEEFPSSPSKAVRIGKELSRGTSQAQSLPRSASGGSRSFQPLFASPFGNHAPVKLPKEMLGTPPSSLVAGPNTAGGGLFAAELAARSRSGQASLSPPGATRSMPGHSSSPEADHAPSSSALRVGRGGRTSSPATGITTPSPAGGADDEHLLDAERATEADRHSHQPSWKVSTIELSDDEGESMAGAGGHRQAKTITVLPYQRYGSLRNKAASLSRTTSRLGQEAAADTGGRGSGPGPGAENDRAANIVGESGDNDDVEDDGDDDDDDLFGYAIHHSPHKDRPIAQFGDTTGVASYVAATDESAINSSSDSEASDPIQRLLLSTLSLHSPGGRVRRRQRRDAASSSGSSLPIQARALLRAQRLNDARHIEALLGAGRDELEMLRVEDEMREEEEAAAAAAGNGKKAAKNWGEAKSRAMPEGGAKGKGRGRPKKEEAASQSASGAGAAPQKPSLAFSRAGRSGLADDEEADADRLADRVLRNHFGASDDEEDDEGRDRAAARTMHAGGGGYLGGVDSDEDWMSEVESDEYGLGDGRMDELDVI